MESRDKLISEKPLSILVPLSSSSDSFLDDRSLPLRKCVDVPELEEVAVLLVRVGRSVTVGVSGTERVMSVSGSGALHREKGKPELLRVLRRWLLLVTLRR